MNKLAEIKLYEGDYLKGFGPLGLEENGPGEAGTIFNKFISTTIGLMSVIAFIYFTLLMITGAYGIMSAGGDKQALETARKRITSGITGVIVVIAAVFIVDFIGELIGIPNILNPAEFLNNLTK